MLKDLFLKFTIKKHLKKLNKKMLFDTYNGLLYRNPKTHIDNVYIKCCIQEMQRRKNLKNG